MILGVLIVEWMRPNVAMREAEKSNLRAVIALEESDVNFCIVHHHVLFAERYARVDEVASTASTRMDVQ